MEKCSCYDVLQYFRTDCMDNIIPTRTVSVCNGTKEREECSCGGDESKCNFYPERRQGRCNHFGRGPAQRDTPSNYGVCSKEHEDCYCGGYKSKCTFDNGMIAKLHDTSEILLSKEESKKIMKTAEMWLEAQKNDKTYYYNDVRYSSQNGLTWKDGGPVQLATLGDTFHELMEWSWKTGISKSEAEKLLGAIIID